MTVTEKDIIVKKETFQTETVVNSETVVRFKTIIKTKMVNKTEKNDKTEMMEREFGRTTIGGSITVKSAIRNEQCSYELGVFKLFDSGGLFSKYILMKLDA